MPGKERRRGRAERRGEKSEGEVRSDLPSRGRYRCEVPALKNQCDLLSAFSQWGLMKTWGALLLGVGCAGDGGTFELHCHGKDLGHQGHLNCFFSPWEGVSQ